ncbi:MAG: hypothetical protein P8J55_05805 [Pseudomonadales bacterium]|nr:hypothetical protein [Pseudomonadales bacterium]
MKSINPGLSTQDIDKPKENKPIEFVSCKKYSNQPATITHLSVEEHYRYIFHGDGEPLGKTALALPLHAIAKQLQEQYKM